MDRSDFLYKQFVSRFNYGLTSCQDALMHKIASFLTGDDADILVVNGYAGTGKTTAVSVVIDALEELKLHTVLLAPTGRAAKVLFESTVKGGRMFGYTENYIRIERPYDKNLIGKIVDVIV